MKVSQDVMPPFDELGLLLMNTIAIAIILNEHLVEAMKRIKEGVSDTSVDR